MMGYYGYNGFGMGFGWILMLLFWIAIIWLIVWLINQNRNYGMDHHGKTASEILRERYARGEITKKEFEKMKRDVL